MRIHFLKISTLIPCLSACTFASPPQKYVAASDVSVDAALISVATGLCQFKKTLTTQNSYLGLYLESVELELNLAANNKQADKLAVDFSKGFQLGPSVGTDHSIEGNRGSKLTLNLKSIANLDKNIVGGTKDGKPAPKRDGSPEFVTFDQKMVLDAPIEVSPNCVLTPNPAS